MRWGTLAIAIELPAKILLHQGLSGVAVIRSEGWERSQTIRVEAIARSLAAFTVQSLVGDFVQPLPRLEIHIGDVDNCRRGQKFWRT